MVTIKRIDMNEFYSFTTYDVLEVSLKNQCDIGNNKQYFAIIDGHKVLGHAVVILFANVLVSKIIEIYILPQERKQGLGDGLLRAILHYLRINSFTHAIIKDDKQLESFLINRGAKKIDFQNVTENIKIVLKKDYINSYFLYNIEEFFKRKCKGRQLT